MLPTGTGDQWGEPPEDLGDTFLLLLYWPEGTICSQPRLCHRVLTGRDSSKPPLLAGVVGRP